MGWALPVATHYQNNVTAGKWYNYSIPAMELTDTNHVLVGLSCWHSGLPLWPHMAGFQNPPPSPSPPLVSAIRPTLCRSTPTGPPPTEM